MPLDEGLATNLEEGPTSKLTMAGKCKPDSKACFVEAIAASKLRCKDRLISCVKSSPEVVNQQDAEGRTCLHFSAEHCEGLEDLLLLEDVAIDFSLKDRNGQTALHFAASAGCPMAAYALAKACPDLCLAFNKAGKIPSDIAKEKNYLEVLNAMLLACCSEDANPKDESPGALKAIQRLLDAGAVPDTWAPNGNSALMMAASADSPQTIALLLQKSAQINMKDTLGRTALMFAAGNNAKAALLALMDAGGQQALSLQDNRGNNVLKYALDDSEVKQLLETRFAELEEAANLNQAALLASLEAEEQSAAAAKTKRSHRGKKKKKGVKSSALDDPIRKLPCLTEVAEVNAETTEQSCTTSLALRPCEEATSANGSTEGTGPATADAIDSALSDQAGHSSRPEQVSENCKIARGRKPADLHESAEAGVISLIADASSPPEQTACLASSSSEGPKSKEAQQAASPVSRLPDTELVPHRNHVTATSMSVYSAANGATEKRGISGNSHQDQLAIRDAIRDDRTGAHGGEEVWQEVKKAGKAAYGKPPLGKRGGEKHHDTSPLLFPSSSSASLDSLGDSTLSIASAHSTPSVMRLPSSQSSHSQFQATKTLAVPPPPPPARRTLPQPVSSPIQHPQASSLPKTFANSNLSWASIVQGAIVNSISAPDLALMEDPPTDSQEKQPEALSQSDKPSTPSIDHEARAETAESAASATLPQHSLDEGMGLSMSSNRDLHSGALMQTEADEVRSECLRLQHLLDSSNQHCLQLQSALLSVQQEHRILLQKAVEDTAKNILQQEQQRYSQQIEALKLLLFQAHQQLLAAQKSGAQSVLNGQANGPQQSGAFRASLQTLHPAPFIATQGLIPPARQRSHPHHRLNLQAKDLQAFESPGGAGADYNAPFKGSSSVHTQKIRDLCSDQLGVLTNAVPRQSEGLAQNSKPGMFPAFSSTVLERGLSSQVGDPALPKSQSASIATSSLQASNPWADTGGAPFKEDVAGPKHLLPGVDSIWGATPGRPTFKTTEVGNMATEISARGSLPW